MKEKEKYEYADKRICKYGIQIDSCRKCIFETLCRIQEGKDDTTEVEKTS